MNEKLWVWIGLGAAAGIGALYVSGVIGPQDTPQGSSETPSVAEAPAPEPDEPAIAAVTEGGANTAPAADSAGAEETADADVGAPQPEAGAPTTVADGTVTKHSVSTDAETSDDLLDEAAATPEAGAAQGDTELALLAPDDAASAAGSEADQTGTGLPSFDLVRAEPGGLITVAGRAEPGSEVFLMLDGKEELSSRVGSDGRFAAFFDLPPSTEAQVLRLRMLWNGETVESEQEVILAPPTGTSAPLVAEGEAPEEGAADSELASVDGGVSAAPTVLMSDARGVEVMQGAAPVAPGGVAIDAITYDDTGGVALSGRGRGQATLQVYLDNTPVTTLRVAADGRWQVALPGVEAGTYTLRVDQVDDAGEVTARAESPFRREPAEKLAAVSETIAAAEDVTAITVQPGNTLWAIARERYGDGLAYVRLFEANKAQIRDPDLIYPGQVFDFPE